MNKWKNIIASCTLLVLVCVSLAFAGPKPEKAKTNPLAAKVAFLYYQVNELKDQVRLLDGYVACVSRVMSVGSFTDPNGFSLLFASNPDQTLYFMAVVDPSCVDTSSGSARIHP